MASVLACSISLSLVSTSGSEAPFFHLHGIGTLAKQFLRESCCLHDVHGISPRHSGLFMADLDNDDLPLTGGNAHRRPIEKFGPASALLPVDELVLTIPDNTIAGSNFIPAADCDESSWPSIIYCQRDTR